jgi:High potential iron-sulfur protein
MSHPPRRTFLMTVALAGPVGLAQAQTPPMLAETDPAAKAQGYAADAKKVDAKKWPKYQAGQLCSNCALYQGKATDAAAPCPLFAGKRVAGPGWCNAWVKKA